MKSAINSPIQTAVNILGSQAALARALGVTPVAVGQWICAEGPKKRKIPPKKCVRIELVTNGQVSRRDLRPDDWKEFWPELERAIANTVQSATETVAQGV